jgi:hypothetical protein
MTEMMEEVKIYGVCLMRLAHQLKIAEQKIAGNGTAAHDKVLLESYCTGDIDEIVDILELYDLEERTGAALREKLQELAYTVSLLTRKTIAFDYTDEGHLGLYFVVVEGAEKEAEPVLAHAS